VSLSPVKQLWPLALRVSSIFAGLLVHAGVHAQSAPLFREVHTIAAPTVAAPVEHQFNITTAGAYQVTLTDLGALLTPSAPLTSVSLALTSGSTIVGTPLQAAGSLKFNATPGTYIVHVLGTPGSGTGSGAIGIAVTSNPGNSQVAAFSDQLQVPPQPLPSSEDVLEDTFAVSAQGSYQVKLTDLQLPQSLTTLTLALTAQGSASLLTTLPDPNSGQHATVTLQSGVTYSIFAIGQASAQAIGGLYSVVVTSVADGSVVYSKTRPIGGVTDLGPVALVAGSSNTLRIADLAFPAALTQLGAVVIQNGTVAATLSAPNTTQQFPATGGTYEAFALATPAASPGVGSYSVQVLPPSGAAALSVARAVTVPGNALTAYNFDTSIPAAGAYVAGLQNFSVPAPLVSVSLAAAQGGALVGALLKGAGSLNLNALSPGPITLLVIAQSAPNSGGLFDVNLTSAGSTTLLFDATQGVGSYFVSRKVTVTTAGNYDVTANDVGFPANFANFAVAITQGANTLGSIFGMGQITFAGTPGDYFVNFLAQPSSTANAGTYALNVAPSPPTISLSSSASNVAQGGVVTLTWSSQSATTCTASSGWSGTQSTSGTFPSGALTAATTFTLTCTGNGGSTSKSVTVTVDPPAKSGGGGGGALDGTLLLMLAGLLGLRIPRPSRPVRGRRENRRATRLLDSAMKRWAGPQAERDPPAITHP
jgi:hypothetical protein